MVTQLFYFFAFIESLTIDEDYDANSRNPYSYKYSIDDPESDTNFEVNLSLLNTKKICLTGVRVRRSRGCPRKL